MTSIKQFFYLLRISHWSKVIFVLLGVLYSGSYLYLPKAILAAISFCFISSAVYIYNDIQDREEDRLHPEKCLRPIAQRQVSVDFAVAIMALLFVSGLLLGSLVSSRVISLLGTYIFINILYNHGLKNIPVFDVLCIASGFMLRVLAGTIGIGLSLSWWLVGAATGISLLIALCKRKLEKQLPTAEETRAVLKKYSATMLDSLIVFSAVFSFINYLLYIIFDWEESSYVLLTLPFAAIGLWRFVWLTRKTSETDDPIVLFFKDNICRITLFSFLMITVFGLNHAIFVS